MVGVGKRESGEVTLGADYITVNGSNGEGSPYSMTRQTVGILFGGCIRMCS